MDSHTLKNGQTHDKLNMHHMEKMLKFQHLLFVCKCWHGFCLYMWHKEICNTKGSIEMKFGVLKDIKNGEYRVVATPA